MKGVIVACLKELVEENFGTDKWEQALEQAGLEKSSVFMPIGDVDDATVMRVVQETCGVLGISQQQAADAFGKHWACTYAPRIYAAYYGGVTSAKDMLLKLDDIHVATTRTIPNARPPHFTYEDVGEDTITMEYHSNRGMMPFFIGLVKGVAENFGEQVEMSTVGGNKVKIQFS